MCRGGFVGFAGSCIGHVARSGGRSSVGVRCIRMQTTAMSTSVFPKWRMDGAVASLPHPAKLEKGGEDAYFLQETVAGVFDGVGGWASQGIDPGLYSRKLAVLTEEQVRASVKYGGEMRVLRTVCDCFRCHPHLAE